MKYIKKEQYKHELLKSSKTKEKYSFSADLSNVIGSNDFFVHHEILPPASKSSAPHFHMETDEIIYILKGNLVAYEGLEEIELGPGDCICFSAKSAQLHFLLNKTESDAEMLVVSKKLKSPDVIY